MLLSLADTHAHLADPAIQPNVASVVESALSADVVRILAVGTNLKTSAACVRLASIYPSVFAAVGIHPQDAAGFDDIALSELRRLASQPKVVAIGEIGLDNVRASVTPAEQEIAFSAQVQLAADLGLPVVVHNRGADDAMLRVISSTDRPDSLTGHAGVLHCFGGNADLAKRANDLGFRISFAGNLTYRRSDALRAVAASVNLNWILLETDCPYLAPEPKRGKTNVPENVGYVARELAAIRSVSLEVIARETSANAAALFSWT